METPKETCLASLVPLAGKIPQAMKKRVHYDNVGVHAIETRRENEIEAQSSNGAIPAAVGRVQKQPEPELKQVRSRNGGHLVPDDPTVFQGPRNGGRP